MNRFLAIAWLSVLLLGPTGLARCSEINERYRAEDARLETRVTVPPGQVLIGDLIANLQKQGAVVIEVDPSDYAPGVGVFISCKDVRICDVLDGIWSLLSSVGGEYEWNREGKPGHYRYKLYEPIAVKRRVELLHRYATQAYLDFVNTMCDLATMPADQRLKHRDTLRKIMVETDEKQVDRWMNDDAFWSNMALFSELAPKGDRDSILLGDRAFVVAVADISEKARKLFDAKWTRLGAGIAHSDGTVTALPMPTAIHLTAVSHGLVPTIMMDSGPNVRDSLFTTAPVNAGLLNLVRKRWLLPLDSGSDALQGSVVRAVSSSDGAETDDLKTPLADMKARTPEDLRALSQRIRRLNQSRTFSIQMQRIAVGSGVPVIAVLPSIPVYIFSGRGRAGTAPSQPDTKPLLPKEPTVAEALAPLEQNGNPLMHKWRNGVLLASYPEWFFDDSRSLPYALVKEFLPAGADGLSLAALAKLMVKATDRQFGELAEHYPLLQHAAGLRPAFLLYKAHPRIITPDGTPLDPDMLQFLQISRLGLRPAIKEGRVERVRLIEVEHTVRGHTGHAVEFQGLVAGNWSLLAGFMRPEAGPAQ